MDNQHRKIKGYRELNQQEVDLMNRIKEKGEEVKLLIEELEGLRSDQMLDNDSELTIEQLEDSDDALTISKINLKTGFMWLVRAVALPESF